MNVLTIIILLILLLFALKGYRKGFIRTLVSMCSFLIAAVLVYFATPYVSDFLKENTPIYNYVEEKCQEAFAMDELPEGEDQPGKLLQTQIIEGLELPEALEKQLLQNNNKAGYEKLAVDSFAKYVSGYMANLILNLITYVAAFLIVMILLRAVVLALDAIAQMPVLRGINRFLGLLLGSLQGLIIIWLIFLGITIFSSTEGGKQMMSMIYESPVLSFLYDTNLFLKNVMKLIASFA